MNAVFVIFVLSLINPWLKRYVPRFALDSSDMVLIYVMLVCLVGHRGSRHDPATVPAHRTRILLRRSRK